MICLFTCKCCEKHVRDVEEKFDGLVKSIQVWILSRGDLQDHDQKMLFAIEHLVAVGLDSGDTGTDVSYPDIERV